MRLALTALLVLPAFAGGSMAAQTPVDQQWMAWLDTPPAQAVSVKCKPVKSGLFPLYDDEIYVYYGVCRLSTRFALP